jgi:glycosyltransferase involved in cell wall biosynthesis
MAHDVAVIVATFGEDRWAQLARTVAVPSAEAERPAELIVHHGAAGEQLHQARNDAAGLARSEWLCFLDADDQLEPGYLAALLSASGDLRAPAVRYVPEDALPGAPDPPAQTFERRNISTMNPCVIGTLIRRQLFEEAGRFWPERAWEDWSLFRRAWLLGATIEHVPSAVYRVTVNAAGRNSTVDRPHTLHREILRSHAAWRRTRKAPT